MGKTVFLQGKQAVDKSKTTIYTFLGLIEALI